MKPLYLSFKAFGPYLEKQEIDFTKLSQAGIYLISGQTGAGKTAILDAMSYALYGVSSGGQRGDFLSMRCQMAKENQDTEVEFIIEVNAKVYKFTRQVRFARKNFNQTQNVFIKNSDGVFQPIYANPRQSDVTEKAIELIGLSSEQFRRVILLPQGQFEKLLTSKSDEKEAVLVSLFGTDKWQKASQRVYEKAKENKDKILADFQSVTYTLATYGCENKDALSALIQSTKEEEKRLKEEHKRCSCEYDKKKKEYETLKEISAKYDEYKETADEFKTLISDEENQNKIEKRLSMCSLSYDIKPLYDKKEDAKINLSSRKKEAEDLKEKLDIKNKSLSLLNEKLETLKSKESQIEQLSAKAVFMESLIPLYTDGEKLSDEKKKAQLDLDSVRQSLSSVNSDYEEKEKEYKIKGEDFKNALDEYKRATAGYILHISSSLAKDLKEGVPCPVCGSLSHPEPKNCDTDAVSEEEKNTKEKELTKAKELFDICQRKKDELSKKAESVQQQYQNTLSEFEKICARAENFEKSKIETIDTLDELNEKISSYQKKVRDYRETFEKTKREFDAYNIEFATLESQYKKALEEETKALKLYEKEKETFDKALLSGAFVSEEEMKNALLTPEEKDALIKQREDYNLKYKSLKEKLENLKEFEDTSQKPDLTAFAQDVNLLSEKKEDASNSLAVLSERLTRMEKDFEAVLKKTEKYQKDISLADSDLEFAKRLRGDTGMGIQRYILAAMLGAVTGEANKLLSEVHAGRYRLHRTSSTSDLRTRKSGLELEVFDRISGETRSVTSLSGGEKFLASLSLSIGLASVVMSQSGGRKLDSMFIDEGFGSLDAQSVSDALSVLSHVKNAKGSVGIISHVSTLKESINTRIEITKSNGTSNLKIITD